MDIKHVNQLCVCEGSHRSIIVCVEQLFLQRCVQTQFNILSTTKSPPLPPISYLAACESRQGAAIELIGLHGRHL